MTRQDYEAKIDPSKRTSTGLIGNLAPEEDGNPALAGVVTTWTCELLETTGGFISKTGTEFLHLFTICSILDAHFKLYLSSQKEA